jgi:hypothetical protein
MKKIKRWKYEGVKCKNCGEQAVVKGYCRKCYDNTPERIKKHKIQSRRDYWKKKEMNNIPTESSLPFSGGSVTEYHKGYYRKNKKYSERMKLYNRLNAVRETIDKVRDCIQIKRVKKLGNSCYVPLPISWNGREVIVFDNKFFELHIVNRRQNDEKKA